MTFIAKNITTIAVALVGILLGIVVAVEMFPAGPVDPNPRLESATVLFGKSRALPPFTLRDHNDQAFDNSSLNNQWSLLFFGFTHCPDVCPTTLQAVRAMAKNLRDDADVAPPKILFVSIDPERDNAAHLKSYVMYFDKSFTGITGELSSLEDFAKSVGAVFRIEEHAAGTKDYNVDHSTHMVLVDPKGRFHGLFSGPHEPGRMARDYAVIIDAYGSS
jgi:protein SCO1